MRRRTLLAGALLAALPGLGHAKAQLTAAQEVSRQCALATAEQKALLVLFHANWCSWCRIFDAFLADPATATVMDRHFRILHMRAQEHTTENKALQLAGADEVYLRYARDTVGLPFFVVLDENERPLVTSIAPKTGENIGFPVQPDELEAFRIMLKRAAPTISGAELAAIREACIRHAPRR